MTGDDEDVKLCNCAGCGKELLGRFETRREGIEIPRVRGRIHDRPYCATCLSVLSPHHGRSGLPGEDSPYQQNAVRDLEDAAGAFEV